MSTLILQIRIRLHKLPEGLSANAVTEPITKRSHGALPYIFFDVIQVIFATVTLKTRDNTGMRILAIFDLSNINDSLEVLRKNRHVVTLVSSGVEAAKLLQGQPFDLVLCQASFESEVCNVFDLLKEIRLLSDVPFICCRVENTIVDNKLDNVFQVTLPLLGGQGFIDSDTFYSRRFLPTIEKCLGNAVGSPCTVAPLYGDNTK